MHKGDVLIVQGLCRGESNVHSQVPDLSESAGQRRGISHQQGADDLRREWLHWLRESEGCSDRVSRPARDRKLAGF